MYNYSVCRRERFLLNYQYFSIVPWKYQKKINTWKKKKIITLCRVIAVTLFCLFVGMLLPLSLFSWKLVIIVQLILTLVINKPPTRSHVRVVGFLFHYFLMLPTFWYVFFCYSQWWLHIFNEMILFELPSSVFLRNLDSCSMSLLWLNIKFQTATTMLIKTFAPKKTAATSTSSTTNNDNGKQWPRGWDKLRTWIAWAFDYGWAWEQFFNLSDSFSSFH